MPLLGRHDNGFDVEARSVAEWGEDAVYKKNTSTKLFEHMSSRRCNVKQFLFKVSSEARDSYHDAGLWACMPWQRTLHIR